MDQMKFKKADAKFVKELLGKKIGFQMGARPVGAVDEKQMTIHDVAVCIQGEALGHGCWLDEAFVNEVVRQGNAAEDGLLCHFGHEDGNAARIKNYMGVFSNFVCKPAKSHCGEDVVGAFADIKFSKTAKAMSDNIDWVLGLARERPDALGLSIVFSVADYKVKTCDGELLWSEYWADKSPASWDEYYELAEAFMQQSVDGRFYVVMDRLYGADFVAEGAATDGLFSVGDVEGFDAAKMSPFKALEAIRENLSAEEPAAETAAPAAEETAAETTAEASAETVAPTAEEPAAETTAEAPAAETTAEEPAAEADPSESVEQLKAEFAKRLSGFQSMHDKKVAELNAKMQGAADEWLAEKKDLNGKIEQLTKELDAAKSESSAFQQKFEKTAGELAETRERLTAVETAHQKLTAGALTVGEPDGEVKTMAEFVKDHGGDFSRAVREDPEMYKRICAAKGCEPVALRYL